MASKHGGRLVSIKTKGGKKYTDYKSYQADKAKSSSYSRGSSESSSGSSNVGMSYEDAVNSLKDSKGNLPAGWGYAVDKIMKDSSYKTPGGNVTYNDLNGGYTVNGDKSYTVYNDNGNVISGGIKGTENYGAKGSGSLGGGGLSGSESGLNAEELSQAWLDKMKSGIEGSANSQFDTIKQNLAEVLSALEGEKDTVQSENTKQLEKIHNNEFATTETQKELMNQYGWNPNNSGLAVGEIGKIKVGADKNRSDANASLVEALNDIARRVSLANVKASNDEASVNKWKDTQLSGAEAQALLYGDEIGYQRYRDSVSDSINNRNFNYQKGIDARNYNYQISRDQVLDDQWLKQFTTQEQQRIIDNAIKDRQISVSEGQLALQKAAQAWQQSHSGSGGSSGGNGNNPETIGPLYSSMMGSSDPAKWLTDNAMYLTKDELKTLYGMLPKTSDKQSLQDLLDSLN
jgi:hypothetical protein